MGIHGEYRMYIDLGFGNTCDSDFPAHVPYPSF